MDFYFEALFLAFLTVNVVLKFWLDTRQIRSVMEHREEVPAAFRESITIESHRRAAHYTVEVIRQDQKQRLVSVIFLLLATVGGLIDVICKGWFGLLGTDIHGQAAIVVTFAVLSSLIDIPFAWIRQFRLEERFGFNNMTQSRFWKDLALNTVLSAVIGIPLLYAVLYLWNAAGDFWWLYAWLVYIGFSLLLLWIYPTFIAPIFNKFRKLPEGELSERVNGLLERIGFAADGLFVMDASRRSAKGNAYMSGFGKHKRIVFFDTLLSSLTVDETEAVLAHELGHYKLHHIVKRMAVSFAVSLALFALLAYLASCPWFYQGLGVTYNAEGFEAAALLLFSFVLPVFLFPFAPLTSKLSRKHEFEADAFAVRHSSGKALVSALVKLFNDNAATLTPDPIYSAFYASHPDAATRIDAIQKHSGE